MGEGSCDAGGWAPPADALPRLSLHPSGQTRRLLAGRGGSAVYPTCPDLTLPCPHPGQIQLCHILWKGPWYFPASPLCPLPPPPGINPLPSPPHLHFFIFQTPAHPARPAHSTASSEGIEPPPFPGQHRPQASPGSGTTQTQRNDE